ncbi:energy transducer TonB [Dyella sp. 2HG41-7]|uniref:energy transducer TonB n=1 Tax=Dyella sp. 2HG41-7 TaxID=2883239 RepID=UPI001F36FCFE|nr:energy transducer TonB [Dyella sp. 2HG41-7]
MKRWMLGTLCLLLACTAWAGRSANAVRKLSEASMLVTGWIEVMPDGTVHQYTVDHPEKLPSVVVDLMQKAAPNWKFHLNDNINAIHRARMNVRIVAKRIDDTHDSISIASASFGEPNATPTDQVSFKDRPLPIYPPEAIQYRVEGTVYLFLRVGKQGQVEDVAAEQVNLDEYGDENQMEHFRHMLGSAAVNAAKKWTYHLPSTGKHVSDPYWYVRVPVNFGLIDRSHPSNKDTYGQWEPYIPGPRVSIPWAKQDAKASPSSDAIPPGSISAAEPSLQLMSELGGT